MCSKIWSAGTGVIDGIYQTEIQDGSHFLAILYPELSFLLRYTTSLSTPILQNFCKI